MRRSSLRRTLRRGQVIKVMSWNMLLLSDGWWYCLNYRRLWCLASLVNCRKLQWWTRSRESWLYLMVGAFSLRKEANVICVVLIYFGCGSVPQLIKQFAIDVNFDENDQLNQFRETPWTSVGNRTLLLNKYFSTYFSVFSAKSNIWVHISLHIGNDFFLTFPVSIEQFSC